MAGPCADFCFARTNLYKMTNVKKAYEFRYNETKKDSFINVVNYEMQRLKPDYVRVHDSGDYYSKSYLKKWLKIAEMNKNIRFYSYTNMVALIKEDNIPDNFDFIFSDSGKQKHLINEQNDRHTKIFNSRDDIAIHGYVDASDNDLLATKWFSKNKRIGLVMK